ncbi:hypothetical protein A1O1_02299 [Capronia coronata CBS 617.96]|uniref:STEEP1 domain-containing protein n=1 Tax=Capronia coronata CBS 617.96 TaxID=1182541 RepID=W9YXC2_9EURO|nr:uncharacterized protein A1O1_02299 [Capronia coronata CBS 617.96]EXJ93906.1 hypothetical protein A1O1_02299 [Capronia coronata CBS 617.96]
MAEEGQQSTPLPHINTYHCLCTTLILTTTHALESLPRRAEPVQDGAVILAPPVDLTASENVVHDKSRPSQSVLLNTVSDRRPVIIRREDGFEKRTLLRCGRCRLVIGYNLDDAHFENAGQITGQERPVYLLPGGMLATADMVSGKRAEVPPWAENIGGG